MTHHTRSLCGWVAGPLIVLLSLALSLLGTAQHYRGPAGRLVVLRWSLVSHASPWGHCSPNLFSCLSQIWLFFSCRDVMCVHDDHAVRGGVYLLVTRAGAA